MKSMYAVILRYKVPLTELDKHVPAHREWLRQHYAAEHFLLSGPQHPRVGGFILVAAMEREALDEILATDPLRNADLADYEVIAFSAAMTAPQLAFLSG